MYKLGKFGSMVAEELEKAEKEKPKHHLAEKKRAEMMMIFARVCDRTPHPHPLTLACREGDGPHVARARADPLGTLGRSQGQGQGKCAHQGIRHQPAV